MANEPPAPPLRAPSSFASFASFALLVALLALSALSGCATMMAGGPDRVPVASNPSNASVFLDNTPVGQTPLVVTLDRAKPKAEIRLEQPGYAPVTVTREKVMNGWIFGNIFFGGLIGVIIDSASNNASKFEEEPINVGFGDHLPPGMDPRVAECRKKRQEEVREAVKLTDKRERLAALRKLPKCG